MKKLLFTVTALALAFTLTGCSLKKDPAPSVTPSATPSVSVSVQPSVTPSVIPTATPSVLPSVAPTATPSATPSVTPSVIPSATPSVVPSVIPTVVPSVIPSAQPTVIPSATPSATPSVTPSVIPSATPTVTPSAVPSVQPSVGPTDEELLSAVTFTNSSKNYNGARQKIEVKNLPAGASVVYSADGTNTAATNVDTYTEEGARKPGVYGVKATVTLNDATRVLTAKFTIRKVRLTVTASNKQKDLYAPHPEFTYTVSGLKGDDVFYFGEENPNLGVEGGEDRATFTGDLTIECAVERYSEVGGAINILSFPESDCYNVSTQSGFLSIKPVTTNLITGTSGGLKLNGDYDMIYNGKVVQWQGVNYFDLWQNCFYVGGEDLMGDYAANYEVGDIVEEKVQDTMRGLEELARYNCKAIRVAAGFFYGWWWEECYLEEDGSIGQKAEECWYLWHRLFNKAAELNIGIIPSVFFSASAYQMWAKNEYHVHAGKECPREEVIEGVFYDESKGSATSVDVFIEGTEPYNWSMAYQTRFLEEFNDHPALFMWEMGNEMNLGIDVGQGVTSDHAISFRKNWVGLIESYNVGYNRIIGSGDGMLRNSQWHQRNENSWGHDTEQQHREMLNLLNPEGMNAVSVHLYFNSELMQLIEAKQKEAGGVSENRLLQIANDLRKQYYEDPASVQAMLDSYGFTAGTTGGTYSNYIDIDTIEEYYRFIVQVSKEIKATCYVGESGMSYTYGETAIQHSKYRNATLSNGWEIVGDNYNPGLSDTCAAENGVYPDMTYQDMLESYMAVSAAQRATGMPLILHWNFEYNANLSNQNGVGSFAPPHCPDWNIWGDRGTGTEMSFSENHWGRARIALNLMKEQNDWWDAQYPDAYNA